MKNLLLAFVLLFALSSQPLLGAADASPEQVVDTSGKKLRVGLRYYIVPVTPYIGCSRYGICFKSGGLSLASLGESSCPLDVVFVGGSRGLPLSFSPVDPKKGTVRVSTDLNIMFSTDHTRCAKYSPVWKLDHFDVAKGQWFVTTGGSVGNPGWGTIRNWFKIEKFEDAYKIVYCPTLFPYSKHLCKDVGLFLYEKAYKRLALSDVPFKVKFQLA
ncbi:kunitz trypsin inhibitor 2-like [Vigna radiata var. radiata]|uniref:Kunitz trypsin inhibitor 2-like n=1 Tax=Vigna radiata var. radiata TaxID=3916 RepID=A0A1S3TMX6_VIGRR|nr:kunitz trypsin inhibitor 2-like [Vigna radiata var. radiata]